MGLDAITRAASQITGAIQQAARSTGASFEYLLTTAQIESSLNPSAQASTSSAKGLYQFIDQTWLATMKAKGASLGYGRYADAIVQDANGQYSVPDAGLRNTIMKLRSDPAMSALMAGAFASSNAAQLASTLGRAPSEGELYIAHFLGPDGAGKLIAAAQAQPRASAVAMFPPAAAANPSIFYTSAGSARSVSEVYGRLTGRFEIARNLTFNAALRGTLGAADTADTADTAGITQAYASANSNAPLIRDTRPLFEAMFSDRARAIAQKVNELWTPPGAEANATRPLSLFGDAPNDPRKLFGS